MIEKQPQRGIVVSQEVTSKKNPPLTLAQTGVVESRAMSYLRKNSLVFNKENFGRAVGVVGVDALQKGLSILGRENLGPKDNIRTVINKGLERRQEVQQKAKKIIDEVRIESEKIPSSQVGPFALPKNLLNACQAEMNNFLLSPNLLNSEKVVYLYESREQMLPKLAGFIVESLNKQFPQVSIENFPKPSEQAKIIRNVITSLIFRNNPLPLITIEELTQFVYQKDPVSFFGSNIQSELASYFSTRLDLPKEEVAPYILGLFIQTREAFSNFASYSIPLSEKDAKERDALYVSFGDILLLSHPALEEQPLITHISRLKGEDGEKSLWSPDLSAVVGSFRVPTIHGLIQAIRSTNAEGYTPERFDFAISAWKQFQRSQKAELTRENYLETRIRDVEQEIARVNRNHNILPDKADWLMRTYKEDQWRAYQDIKRKLRIDKETVADSRNLRSKAFEYIASIQNESGELPEQADLPSWLLEVREKLEAERPKRVLDQARGKMYAAVAALRGNFLTQYSKKFSLEGQKIENRSTEQIQSLVADTKNEMRRVRREKPQMINLGQDIGVRQVSEHLDTLLEGYEGAIVGSLLAKRPEKLRYLKKNLLELISSAKISAGIPGAFYVFCLLERKEALEKILWAKQRIQNPPEVVRPSSKWEKEQIQEWIKKIKISTLPEDIPLEVIDQYGELLVAWWREFGVKKSATSLFPKTISSENKFLDDLHNTIKNVKSVMRPLIGVSEGVRERHQARVERMRKFDVPLLDGLLSLVNNPLFPLSEGKGFSRHEFFLVLSKRIRFINAQMEIRPLEQLEKQHKAKYLSDGYDLYVQVLSSDRNKYKGELRDIQSDDPPSVRNFISKMKELNLALEEVSE